MNILQWHPIWINKKYNQQFPSIFFCTNEMFSFVYTTSRDFIFSRLFLTAVANVKTCNIVISNDIYFKNFRLVIGLFIFVMLIL